MGNIIRLNESDANNEWLVMSNQGTDCFLDLLVSAADSMEKTVNQEELVSFLKDRKDINDIAPGTAGFDIVEMPWHSETLKEDVSFLIGLTEKAGSESCFEKLPYDADKGIVLPWLKQFAMLVGQIVAGSER
ncbi:MAG: hypothetical protein IK026_01775 [Eubacteriaceae bacterium]|nr:hypothetical protein [Eubacteriaceae bacterium]